MMQYFSCGQQKQLVSAKYEKICGWVTVGRVFSSNTIDQWFESRNEQKFLSLSTTNCTKYIDSIQMEAYLNNWMHVFNFCGKNMNLMAKCRFSLRQLATHTQLFMDHVYGAALDLHLKNIPLHWGVRLFDLRVVCQPGPQNKLNLWLTT